MKLKQVVLVISIILLLGGSITCIFASGRDSFSGKWGNYLNEKNKSQDDTGAYHTVTEEYSKFTADQVDKDEIYAIGINIIIAREDIDQVKTFYILSGYSEEEATGLAIEYTEQYESIWLEAVKKGYLATDEEIKNRLDELGKIFAEEDNKADIQDFINSFDSVDDFWAYEYKVYQKSIPIEKYRKEVLEKDFSEITKETPGTDAYWVEWDTWFEEYQISLVDKQAFIYTESLTSEELNDELTRFSY